jgi:hypothetical protein
MIVDGVAFVILLFYSDKSILIGCGVAATTLNALIQGVDADEEVGLNHCLQYGKT